MRLPRLPVPLPPARQETIASYLARLASVHGLPLRELWEPISTPRPGTARRTVLPERLAAITGRAADHLARALPELRDPAPDWTAWRHQPQPRCPRCDARHEGGPVIRLLPHHRYVCHQHRYWIGPPDAGQPATKLDDGLDDIVRAQRHHRRLIRRHGTAAAFDAVLTGFLIRGHLWAGQPVDDGDARHQWQRRAEVPIPTGSELSAFSASRLFAAVYPEAVSIAGVIASPAWRRAASGGGNQQRQFTAEIGRRLGRPGYQPPEDGDAIAHWLKYDARRPPSRPDQTFPDTRQHGAIRPTRASTRSRDRNDRSAAWFGLNRRGGSVILHHRHIRRVLIREWSPTMDGITATIFASRATIDLHRCAMDQTNQNGSSERSAGDPDRRATESAT